MSVESKIVNAISAMDDTVKSVDDKVVKLENTPFKGKWISIFGDSISTYAGWIPSENATWYPNNDVNDVTKTWWHKLLTKLGAKLCVNQSWSGRKVTDTSDTASAACNAINKLHREAGKTYINLDGTTTTETKEIKPDIILIMLGINDFNNGVPVGDLNPIAQNTYSSTSFSDSYSSLLLDLQKIGAKYPNAKLYLMNICYSNKYINFGKQNSGGSRLNDYRNCIDFHSGFMECNVIHMNRLGVTTTNGGSYLIDSLHPKASMMTLIDNQCYKEMMASNCL